jgi:hypothetical protein
MSIIDRELDFGELDMAALAVVTPFPDFVRIGSVFKSSKWRAAPGTNKWGTGCSLWMNLSITELFSTTSENVNVNLTESATFDGTYTPLDPLVYVQFLNLDAMPIGPTKIQPGLIINMTPGFQFLKLSMLPSGALPAAGKMRAWLGAEPDQGMPNDPAF